MNKNILLKDMIELATEQLRSFGHAEGTLLIYKSRSSIGRFFPL